MLTYTVFEGFEILAQGTLEEVALHMRKRLRQKLDAGLLLFSDSSGKQMDLDLSGSEKDVLGRLQVFKASDEAPTAMGPGRPKLGVVCREVSLLPRHWEWLSNQSGGTSAAIRRLIDENIRAPLSEKDRVKQSQEAAYRFLSALAGNLPNFEEAVRQLYRRDKKKFKSLISDWPSDVIKYTLNLTESIF